MTCSYGDTCGTTLTGTDIIVTNAAAPWELNAKNDIKKGYEKSLCLKCTVNNALTKSPF